MLAATNPTGRAETTTNPRDSAETTTYPTGSAATTTNPTGSAGTTPNPTGSSEELEYWLELPPHVLEECSRSFERIESQPSNFQRAVGSALSDLSLTFEAEVVAPEGYSIDFVIESAGRPVAIEVDGPIHYLGTSKLPRGATVLKRRQLEAFGWRVVSLPYWEWQEFVYLKNTEKRRRKRRDLLRRRLDEALGEASSRGMIRLSTRKIGPQNVKAAVTVTDRAGSSDVLPNSAVKANASGEVLPARPSRRRLTTRSELTGEKLDAIARRMSQSWQ